MIEFARNRRIEKLFLLTLDAEPFFLALGFEPIKRSDAPVEIMGSGQFQSACPESAVLMARGI